MNNAAEREKGESPSGLAANALSARRSYLSFYSVVFFLWRVLERGGEAAALVYSSTRHSAKLELYHII